MVLVVAVMVVIVVVLLDIVGITVMFTEVHNHRSRGCSVGIRCEGVWG